MVRNFGLALMFPGHATTTFGALSTWGFQILRDILVDTYQASGLFDRMKGGNRRG